MTPTECLERARSIVAQLVDLEPKERDRVLEIVKLTVEGSAKREPLKFPAPPTPPDFIVPTGGLSK